MQSTMDSSVVDWVHAVADASAMAVGAERRRDDRLFLGALALGHFANDWTAGSLLLLTPAIAAAMGLGPIEVGLLLTINGLGAGLAYLPAGIAADHTRRRGLLLCLTFWWVTVGYLVASLAPDYWSLTLLLAVAVMGDAAWHPIATGVLAQRMPDRKAQALGIHAMGGTIGAEAVAPLAVGFLLAWFDWRTVMQLSVVPAAVVGLVFIAMVKRIGPAPQQRFDLASLRALLARWRTPLGFGLIAFAVIYNMASVAAIGMTPLFLQTHHGLSPVQTGLTFAVMVSIGSCLQPVFGYASDRLGRKLLLVGALGVAGVTALGAAYFETFAPFVACLVVAVALLTAIRPVMLAAAVEVSGERESTTLGMAFTLMDGIGACGAVLAGIAGSRDLSYAFLMVAALAMIASTIAFCLPFRRPG